MHKCPGCPAAIDYDKFACSRCWRRLPSRLKASINAAWRAVMNAKDGSLQQHAAAKSEAVDWLLANCN